MVNQWGREGQVSAGGTRLGAVLIASALSLLIGGAGGYGAARYYLAEPQLAQTEKPAATVEIATSEREKSLEALVQEAVEGREAASLEAERLRQSYAEAQGKVGTLEARVRTLEAQAKSASSPLSGDREDFADRLRERVYQLEEQASSDDRTIATLRLAEQKLQGQLDRIIAEHDRRGLIIRDTEALLETSRSDLRASVAEVQKLRQQITDLKSITAKQSSAEDAARALKKRLSDAEARSKALVAERDAAQAEIAALKAEAARVAEPAAPAPKPSPDKPVPPTENADAMPRDQALVEQALARAPGLRRLTNDKRSQLETRLREGACVTTALEEALGRVPAIALRSLIRDLDSPC